MIYDSDVVDADLLTSAFRSQHDSQLDASAKLDIIIQHDVNVCEFDNISIRHTIISLHHRSLGQRVEWDASQPADVRHAGPIGHRAGSACTTGKTLRVGKCVQGRSLTLSRDPFTVIEEGIRLGSFG